MGHVGRAGNRPAMRRRPHVRGPGARLTGPNTSGPAPRTYQDRHGNATQMETGRIGRRAAELDPLPASRQGVGH